ncbi:MAG: RNA polymerase sigma factor [Candidatus Doudnabacteria bacterium]|nr:RNA polymerase sigma factor [Candidatus Doudnabacteria bacterium]
MEELNSLTDEQVAKKVQQGDVESFGILVERYEAKMLRYARRFLFTDTAEDMAQEVFLKVYQNIKSYNPQMRFNPWIYRIAHNEFINKIKKNGREELSFFDPDTLFPHPVSSDNPEKDTDRELTKKMLDKYLDKIGVKYREVLVLNYLEELSYKEIADVLKIPVSTVGVRIKRAKEAIQKVSKLFMEETYGRPN